MDTEFVVPANSAKAKSRPLFMASSRRVMLVLIVVLFLWPKYLVFAPSISPYTLMVIICTVISCGVYLSDKSRIPRLAPISRIAIWAFILLFMVRFGADLVSSSLKNSLYFDFRDLMWGGNLFFIATILARNPVMIGDIAKLACWAALAILASALVEQFTLTTLPALILGHIPISIDEQFEQMLISDKSRDGAFRSQAFFSHPIVMGLVSASIFPLAVSTLLNGRERILSLTAMVACVATIMLGGTRSGQIALIVAVICHVFFLIVLSRSRFVLSSAAFMLPLVILTVPPVIFAIEELAVGRSSVEQRSSDMRTLMWERGSLAIAKSPIVGYGGGNSPALAGIPARVGSTYTVDDYYLSLILDGGYLSLGLLVACVFVLALVTLSAGGSPPQRRMRAAYFSGIIAILVSQKATSITEGMALFYLYSGIIVSSNVRTVIMRKNAGIPRHRRHINVVQSG